MLGTCLRLQVPTSEARQHGGDIHETARDPHQQAAKLLVDSGLALPGATHDVKWGQDHCYSIGGKMFAVIGPDGSMSFKVDDERFLELTDRAGMIPAPYMAKHKWVLVQDLKKADEAEVRALVKRS